MEDVTVRPNAERVGYVGLGKIAKTLPFFNSTTPVTPGICAQGTWGFQWPNRLLQNIHW